MIRTLKLLLCLFLFSICAEAQKPLLTPCGGAPLLALLSKGAGASLLKVYGYDLRDPWACTKVESSWTAGATILRFRKITVEADDHTSFSVMKVVDVDHIWVIPTEAGMLEVAHVESDPHNLAAFNALLVRRKGPIDAAGWLEAGNLFMALLGYKEVISMNADAVAENCSTGEECSVSFSDRRMVPGEAYNKWTLVFAAPSKGQSAKLTDVSKETVQP